MTAPLQLGAHVKARGEENPQFRGRRQHVPDSLVPWISPFSGYAPKEWTHQSVLDNSRELSTGDKWADPPDVTRAGLGERVTYAGDGEQKLLSIDRDNI